MKIILLLSVFVASALQFSHNANAQVFKPDSAATMLGGSLSYSNLQESESFFRPASLTLGVSYNKFIAGGLYSGITLSLESMFYNWGAGKRSIHQPAAGIQAGYFFGKPGQVVYPFAGAFSSIVYSSRFRDGSLNEDELVLKYGPQAGVLFYVHENIGITVQGVFNFTGYFRESKPENRLYPDRLTQINIGVTGILF